MEKANAERKRKMRWGETMGRIKEKAKNCYDRPIKRTKLRGLNP
jgi:hypothetical protein